MKNKLFSTVAATAVTLALLAASSGMVFAQAPTTLGSHDSAVVEIGPASHPMPSHSRELATPEISGSGAGTPYHPVYFVQRHPDPGCSERLGLTPPMRVYPREKFVDRVAIFFHLKHRDRSSAAFRSWETSTCGTIVASGWTHNMRVSAGTTWQYNQMAGTTAAVGTYIALTNTAITPAEADTTLSGEIATNGLARALSTPTNASTTLSVPGAPTPTVVGTTGSTTYYYWVAACNQGICTTPSATSGSVTTANATLSPTNYVSVAFTGQLGAATYQIYRTTSNSAPASGAQTVLINGVPACSTAGTTVSCTALDTSNTLTSVTIPASNLTNFGKYTLVYTWTATATQSAQAFAVFNASSSGTMVFEGTFTQVTLNNGDTLQLTETVYF